MPGKIKSGKQFRMLEMKAHGGSGIGPSQEVAKKMLSHESYGTKSMFAKEKRKKR